MFLFKRSFFAVAAFIFAGFSATHATAETTIETLLAQGHYTQALLETEVHLAAGPATGDLHLLRGFAYLGLGQLDAAKQQADAAGRFGKPYLYFILQGHIAARNKAFNYANLWYRRASDIAANDAETKTATSLSGQMQSVRKWVWTANISLRQSDNLNFATDNDEVELDGLPFVLAEENTAQEGSTITAALAGKYKLVNTSNQLLQAGLTGQIGLTSGSGVTAKGFGMVLDGQRVFGADTADQIVLRYGLTAARNTPAGGTPTVSKAIYVQASGALVPDLQWSVRLNASRTQGEDAINTQSDLSATYRISGRINDGLGYGIGITHGRIISDNPHASSTHNAIRFEAQSKLELFPVNLGIFADYAVHDYDMQAPFFDELRHDRIATIGINLAPQDWTVMGMQPSITLRKSRRDSNIDINDAASQDIFVGLRSSF